MQASAELIPTTMAGNDAYVMTLQYNAARGEYDIPTSRSGFWKRVCGAWSRALLCVFALV